MSFQSAGSEDTIGAREFAGYSGKDSKEVGLEWPDGAFSRVPSVHVRRDKLELNASLVGHSSFVFRAALIVQNLEVNE